MLRSLVGSEMCIRDRCKAKGAAAPSSAATTTPVSGASKSPQCHQELFKTLRRFTLQVTDSDLLLIPLDGVGGGGNNNNNPSVAGHTAQAFSKVLSSVSGVAAAVAASSGWAGGGTTGGGALLDNPGVIVIPRYAIRDVQLLDGLLLVRDHEHVSPTNTTTPLPPASGDVSAKGKERNHGHTPPPRRHSSSSASGTATTTATADQTMGSSPATTTTTTTTTTNALPLVDVVRPLVGLTIMSKAPFPSIQISFPLKGEAATYHHEHNPHYFAKRSVKIVGKAVGGGGHLPSLQPFTINAFYFGCPEREELLTQLGFTHLSPLAAKLLKAHHEDAKTKFSQRLRNVDGVGVGSNNRGVTTYDVGYDECMSARVFRVFKTVITSFMYYEQQLLASATAAAATAALPPSENAGIADGSEPASSSPHPASSAVGTVVAALGKVAVMSGMANMIITKDASNNAMLESSSDGSLDPSHDAALEMSLQQELSQSFAASGPYQVPAENPTARTLCVPLVMITGLKGMRITSADKNGVDATKNASPSLPLPGSSSSSPVGHISSPTASSTAAAAALPLYKPNDYQVSVSDGAAPESNLSMFLFTHHAAMLRLTHINRVNPLPRPFDDVDTIMQNGFLSSRVDFIGHSVECDVVASILRPGDATAALLLTLMRSLQRYVSVDPSNKKNKSTPSDKDLAVIAKQLSTRLEASRRLHSHVALICDFCELLTQQRGDITHHFNQGDNTSKTIIPSHVHFPVSEAELKWFRTQLSAIQQENRHLASLHSRIGTSSSPSSLPKSSSTTSTRGDGSGDDAWELLDKNGSNGHLWSVAPQEWFSYDFFSEFHRQKVDWEVWGTSFINTSFEACGTYPPFLIVPASLVMEEEKNENQRRLNAQNHGGSLAGFLSAPSWAASVAERRTRQQHAVVESVLEAAFSPTDTSRNHNHSPLHDGATVSTTTHAGGGTNQPFPRTPLLADAFQCRSSQRLQVLTYYHAPTRAAILRSSQPMSLRCRTYYSSTHQTYWNELLKASPSGRVLVVDLRPFVNAAANMALGGGYEAPQYATPSSASHRLKKPSKDEEDQATTADDDLVDAEVVAGNGGSLDVEIHFANIANIHVVRAAYESIPTAAEQLVAAAQPTIERNTPSAEVPTIQKEQNQETADTDGTTNKRKESYREYMQSWLKWKKDSNSKPSSTPSDEVSDVTSIGGCDLRVAPPSVAPEALTAQYRLVLDALDVIVSNISGTNCFTSTGDGGGKKSFTPRNVLLHCTDGWDRTSQLCALSQPVSYTHLTLPTKRIV
eukprot:TRINITY_DN9719_c0_g1_i3.p1 TRINITY_DN9719_c0_g1~~TRINITY_DN9719_c0_g1_i3.p1  ORF type:complete len:1328 (+),score=230.08 TRINITY_DN9719_c0_g1_i3:127-3984(+)